MKINDRRELHIKTASELQKLLKEAYTTLSRIKLEHAQAKLKNTRSLFNTRQEIAVMQSILTMKLATKEEEKAPEKEKKVSAKK